MIYHIFLNELLKIKDEGCKFCLSGTDSLGFWLSKDEELYDNCCFYHTTFIGYNEFKYIYESIEKREISIDEYVHYGGLFEKSISDIKVYQDKFRFNLSQQYQYNGIAKNIQNALSRRINDFSL